MVRDGNQRTYADIQIDRDVNRNAGACGSICHSSSFWVLR